MIHHDVMMVGASPDGLIAPNGGVEIKCPHNPVRHYAALKGMPTEHAPQVQTCIWLAEAEWWDFVSFDPRFPPHLRLIIHRIERDDGYISDLHSAVSRFLDETAVKVEEMTV